MSTVISLIICVIAILCIIKSVYDDRQTKKLIESVSETLAEEGEKAAKKEQELRQKESELAFYEARLNALADELNLDAPNSQELAARYFVSESDVQKYTTDKTMASAIKRQLAKSLADSIVREFKPVKKEADGREVWVLTIRAKQI